MPIASSNNDMSIRLHFFAIIIVLLGAASPAAAVNCDCNRKIKECSATAKFLRPDVVEFRSGSQCSFIFYRLNGLAYYTTIINGVETVDYLRNPAQREAPTVSVESCDVCVDLDAEKSEDNSPTDQADKKAAQVSRPQKLPPDQSTPAKPTFSCPAKLTYLPDDGTMETAWRNQLMQSCKAAFPDMYPEQTDPPPIKTQQQLEASRRAHLAKIQEAKEKHAREEQQSAAAARQLQAEEELNRQRQATMRSLIDAANIAAGVYSVLPKAPAPAKKPPPPAKTYSTPSNRLTPGTKPQQSTTPTSPSRSTCDQPGCAIREVE